MCQSVKENGLILPKVGDKKEVIFAPIYIMINANNAVPLLEKNWFTKVCSND